MFKQIGICSLLLFGLHAFALDLPEPPTSTNEFESLGVLQDESDVEFFGSSDDPETSVAGGGGTYRSGQLASGGQRRL